MLFVIVPAFYLADFVLSPAFRRSTAIAAVLFAVVVCAGLCAGMGINVRYHGERTFLCSDDSWWPRLFGANVRTVGFRNSEDRELILRRYEQDHGVRIELERNTCAKELVPYIKAEIARRWSMMTARQKARFVAVKEISVWGPKSSSFQGWRKPYGESTGWLLRILVGVGMTAMLGRVFLRICVGRPPAVHVLFALAPVVFCFGLFCVFALVEANPRYGRIALCLFPVYAPGILPFRDGLRMSEKPKRLGMIAKEELQHEERHER